MQTFKTLTDAIALAEFAHRNQLDKAGLPYIEHPKRVLAKVQAQGAMPYVQIAAILHDVTEDTPLDSVTLCKLGFSEAAVLLVELLDRNISKFNYWKANPDNTSVDEFYYKNIRRNQAAKMIKLADIEDNLSAWRLSYLEPKTQERLGHKYAKALRILSHQEDLGWGDSAYVPWLKSGE